MQILSTSGWDDYELVDSGDGYRLERFGKYLIVRPDPQVIWHRRLTNDHWEKVDAVFSKEKDQWQKKTAVPEKWLLRYDNLSFWAQLTPFKHTGVFPEQLLQWQWMKEKVLKEKRQLNILNLFAYTGIGSLVCASLGAKVTHVDASRPTMSWARENQKASELTDKPIRWILDDAIKFTQREMNRGVRYDAIIMDPPVYGHGPNGEKWNFSTSFPLLLELCRMVLSEKPAFVLINAYALSASSLMLENMLLDFSKKLQGTIEVGELTLKESTSERLLSTGIFGRWSSRIQS